MLLVQQRNPTDQMIEQRPQASSQNIQAERGRLPLRAEPRSEPKTEVTAKRRAGGSQNVENVQKADNFLQNRTPSRAEFGNGEIDPAANEMRSTTPKSTDEWAPGL